VVFTFNSIMQSQTAVLLVNTGTPDSPNVSDVRSYLREFLGDKRVINMPWLTRKMLVNLIIAPFRGPKSAKLYEQIWTPEGSPLLVNSKKFTIAMQQSLGSDHQVYTAMRYGNPSMESAVIDASGHGIKKFILVPLYPQYADSTTGTIVAEFNRLLKKHNESATTTVIQPFFNDQGFIEAFAEKIKVHEPKKYDHVIFSFHGLPVKQTEKMHPGLTCKEANCQNEYNKVNERCYYASC
jgi:protoporphyrin/coproporphyrin ferrochelatase